MIFKIGDRVITKNNAYASNADLNGNRGTIISFPLGSHTLAMVEWDRDTEWFAFTERADYGYGQGCFPVFLERLELLGREIQYNPNQQADTEEDI